MTQIMGGEPASSRKDHDYEVVINGTRAVLDDETVSYEQLGELAYPGHDPQALFTVA